MRFPHPSFVIFQYHSKLQRLLAKYSCMNSGDGGKMSQEKTIDGCAKSQSFYSGMNQLVHVANSSAISSTTTTTLAATGSHVPASPGNGTRVRNCYYNCCSCSASPAASVTSTVSLCPSHLLPLDCQSRLAHHQAVQIQSLAPHFKLEHWIPPFPVRDCLPPVPYLYSSAYEAEPVSPVPGSNLSLEHIYSQIPSPQPTPKVPSRASQRKI